MGLTIIIATLGRPSLDRTIQSVRTELGTHDEVIVATRFPDRVHGRLPDNWRWRLIRVDGPEAYGGATERNAVMGAARGSHLCFIDDDDVYTPGALDAMRDAACDRPVIFRVDLTRLGTGVIWREPVLEYTNVSTQGLLVPNVLGKLGHWEAYQHGRGCDYTFITETVAMQGDPIFRSEIVAVGRPHAQEAAA